MITSCKMNDDIDLPVEISFIGGKYLLFSIEIYSYLRRQHRICGMLVGTLPQSPSQNVFLGLPVQLMPEEVFLLVDKGIASVIDDRKAHRRVHQSPSLTTRSQYLANIESEGAKASMARLASQNRRKQQALEKRKHPRDATGDPSEISKTDVAGTEPDQDSLFSATTGTPPPSSHLQSTFTITPPTSAHLLPPSSEDAALALPTPTSYPLYAHLHNKGYFITPGLRFGCQFTVYPDDPLRYHSHFLANSTQWDEDINLMDIVGGGRLGTGVKKGYLFGGEDPNSGNAGGDNVRTFSVEWAGM